MRAYVKERFPHPALLDVSESGRTGAIETLRRRALYVDLSPDGGAVGTTPESITANEANEWLKVAGFGQEYIKRSEEHTSELQSLMRISYAVFCLKQKKHENITTK